MFCIGISNLHSRPSNRLPSHETASQDTHPRIDSADGGFDASFLPCRRRIMSFPAHQDSLAFFSRRCLCTAIAETREVRHDIRHHFNVLQGLAANQEWDKLMDYLTKSSGIIPNTELNLCENTAADAAATLEASLKTDSAKRHILVQAYLHSDRMILLTVENIFDGNITVKNGEYQSSKRSGCGIGLQSVRHIAEKSGGYSRFLYENGTFCANIILRAEK